mmetsp:Transcript_16859/g.51916  ORF Transcript_16859/g.51916 Transcript_16859/m.51916 type:complete len:278 (-) Transcript_16859:171-1004(-)
MITRFPYHRLQPRARRAHPLKQRMATRPQARLLRARERRRIATRSGLETSGISSGDDKVRSEASSSDSKNPAFALIEPPGKSIDLQVEGDSSGSDDSTSDKNSSSGKGDSGSGSDDDKHSSSAATSSDEDSDEDDSSEVSEDAKDASDSDKSTQAHDDPPKAEAKGRVVSRSQLSVGVVLWISRGEYEDVVLHSTEPAPRDDDPVGPPLADRISTILSDSVAMDRLRVHLQQRMASTHLDPEAEVDVHVLFGLDEKPGAAHRSQRRQRVAGTCYTWR